MSASTWVPLVTAAAGLITGLATGLGTTVLARRWASEDRRAAWQREDQLRWQQDRLQAYTRLISALDDWNAEKRRVWDGPPYLGDPEEPLPFDADEWERHARAVTELEALLRLMAPDRVYRLAGRCRLAYTRLGSELAMQGANLARRFAAAEEAESATRSLIEAMRADLGLGGDGQPVGGTAPHPARRSGEPRPPDRPGELAGCASSQAASAARPSCWRVSSRACYRAA
jgi:hypothetical protein